MRFITIIIVLITYSIQSSAQNYAAYYTGINKAKKSIIENNLESGVNYYHETFENFEFVFARDCFNALEVSSNLKDFEMMDYFLKRCLIQGVEFDYLQRNTLLNEYKKTRFWEPILLIKDSLKSIYTKNVNWEIRTEINKMFTEDQRIRDLADKNRFNVFSIRKLNKEFKEIDHKLVLRLIEITKQYGFPGERLIGIDNSSMHPKVYTNRLTAGMPIVIFIHHFSQPNPTYNPLLIQEIQSGYLSNEHYAIISDFQHKFGEEKYGVIPCYSDRFSPKTDAKTIDENRNNIYMISQSNAYALNKTRLITPFWVGLY